MNTHDKYELPPLPDLPAYSSEVFDREVKVVSETMAEQLMHDYARAAIALYQQRIEELETQLEAIGAGGVSSQRITSQRRGESVTCFKCGHAKHGGECVNVAPQPAEPSCNMGDHACSDPSQCWEPCGKLGKSTEHAKVAEPVNMHSDAETTDRVGAWLSAALCDPAVCQEMKDDIWAWMKSGQPNVQPVEPVKVPSDAQSKADRFRNGVARILGLGSEGGRFADTYLLGLISDLVELEDEFHVRDERRIAMRETTYYLLYEHKEGFSSHPKKSDLRKHIKELDAENDRLHALLARYSQNPTIPAGWKLVPKVPTHEMIAVFVEQWHCHRQSIDDPQMGDAYQAMLEAAPEPPCTL